jgi:hypothetical protein
VRNESGEEGEPEGFRVLKWEDLRVHKLLRGMVADHYCSGVPASAIPYTGSDLGPVGMMVKKTS